MNTRTHLRLAGWGVAALVAAAADATQHLVTPGDDWSRLADRLKPGDEIILMPGRHTAASFTDLHGEPNQPIIIRAVSPDHPVTISAREEGLHFTRPRFVVIQDVHILNATANGINIDDGLGDRGNERDGNPWRADIRLVRVKVSRTGPIGNTDGIKLSGLEGVKIEDCAVEGWGGSAVDMVGCREVRIERCVFTGLRDFGQSSGVQAKGGSADILIDSCEFRNAGERAVNLGGSTGLKYFRPAVADDASAGSLHEAERVTVERCLFVGGDCAVAFVGSRGCIVRSCTIINPKLWAFRILQENEDARFGACREGTVGQCLIVYDGESVRSAWNVGPNVDSESFVLEENLWWAGEGKPVDHAAMPGEHSEEQIVGVDPRLDAKHQPRNPAAAVYGRGG